MSGRGAGPAQEPDRVDGRNATLIVAGSLLVILGFCLVAWLVLAWSLEGDGGERPGRAPSLETRLFPGPSSPVAPEAPSGAEAGLLEEWGRVDAGRVRIPVSEAMRALVQGTRDAGWAADTGGAGAPDADTGAATRPDTAVRPDTSAPGPGPAAASPPAMEGVDVVERRGAAVPRGAEVVDGAGRSGRLAAYVAATGSGPGGGPGPPVVLAPVYYRCRTLCGLVMDGLARGLAATSLEPGTDYRVVTLGIDPREGPADVAARRERLLRALPEPADPELPGWTLLRGGSEAAVRGVADALGFGYRYDPRTDQFAHPAVAVVLTPDGRVAEYLYGVRFPPADLERAVARAAAGDVGGGAADGVTAAEGSALERVLLRCFRYTPALRRYAGLVAGLLRGGGVVILLALGLLAGVAVRKAGAPA